MLPLCAQLFKLLFLFLFHMSSFFSCVHLWSQKPRRIKRKCGKTSSISRVVHRADGPEMCRSLSDLHLSVSVRCRTMSHFCELKRKSLFFFVKQLALLCTMGRHQHYYYFFFITTNCKRCPRRAFTFYLCFCYQKKKKSIISVTSFLFSFSLPFFF